MHQQNHRVHFHITLVYKFKNMTSIHMSTLPFSRFCIFKHPGQQRKSAADRPWHPSTFSTRPVQLTQPSGGPNAGGEWMCKHWWSDHTMTRAISQLELQHLRDFQECFILFDHIGSRHLVCKYSWLAPAQGPKSTLNNAIACVLGSNQLGGGLPCFRELCSQHFFGNQHFSTF